MDYLLLNLVILPVLFQSVRCLFIFVLHISGDTLKWKVIEFLRISIVDKKTGNIDPINISGAPAKESMRQDLNLRPLRPERSALPN